MRQRPAAHSPAFDQRRSSQDSGRLPPEAWQLFVFPHAGGSAAQYRRWAKWLPPGVDVLPLELPGHGARLREDPASGWEALIDDVVAQLRARRRPERRYLLAGHSLGALLAYESARVLERTDSPAELLIVSGRNGPSAGISHRPIHQLPDEHFLTALRRLGGTPDRMVAQQDLVRLFLPAMRAGLRLAETYRRSPGPPLAVPVTVFGGRQDRLTEESGLIAWSRETTGVFDLTLCPGGHFFTDDTTFTSAFRLRLARHAAELSNASASGPCAIYSSPVEFTTS
uniref:Type II thioesterase n=1 Tax=Streptomyces sp. CNQ-418 TaxID=467194 RepID=J7GY90_9ACTN|nr:type II thioesterase [Streptomyces sp. CNQ-418]